MIKKIQPSQQHKTRQHLLDTGYQLIISRGFSALGLSELLQQAGVSKGAFYHHFSSKEDFGVSLIKGYFTCYFSWLDELLTDTKRCGKERIFSYWNELQRTQSVDVCERPCLVVKLSAEVSGLSEPMRLALQNGCNEVLLRLTACIADGQRDGSLPENRDAEELAGTLYYLWLGACLANALERNDTPLEVAMEHTRILLGCHNKN